MEKRGKNKICTICGKEYYVRRNRVENSKYCSRTCWSKRNPPNKTNCKICGKKIITYQRSKFLCSLSCKYKYQSLYLIGKKSPGYKDGNSLKRERARMGKELKEWRKKVFTRDKYICQECGEKRNLQAHHLIGWAENEEARFDLNNGKTLCIDCHGKIHGKDFRNRRKRECSVCGKAITNQNNTNLCRSCAIKKSWEKRTRS